MKKWNIALGKWIDIFSRIVPSPNKTIYQTSATPSARVNEPSLSKFTLERSEGTEGRRPSLSLPQTVSFREAEFRTEAEDERQYFILSSIDDLPNYPTIAVDTETDGLEKDCKLKGCSFCGEPGKAYWLPIDRYEGADVWEALKGKTLIMHNAKFDLQVLARHGCDLDDANLFDTMIAHHLLDENSKHGLKDLAESLLQEKVVRYDDLQQMRLTGENPSLAFYGCADADYTFRLYELFKPRLAAEGLEKLFSVEMALIPIIRDMENTGITLSTERLSTLEKSYKNEQLQVRNRIFKLAGGAINLNAPTQVSDLLYDKLKLPSKKVTPTGKPSIDNEALTAIKDSHEVVGLILRWRELDKLLTTYIETLPNVIDDKSQVHCEFNQIGTVTGRFSCRNPNLQNIPRDKEIRSVFIPLPGHVFIDADFSQIELRCMAHYSQDEKMVEAYIKGLDLHRKTIADMLGKSIDDVTDDERFIAKSINFGLIYGMGATGLSKRLGVSEEKAEKFMEQYFNAYSGVKQFMFLCRKEAEQRGYVVTMFGRRRRFSDGNCKDALNALIQGTAGDLCKISMVRLAKALPPYVKMLLTIHDEILFEVPQEQAEEVRKLILEMMEKPVKGIDGKEFTIPIKVEATIADNWGEAKD
jgi:DNA polymerase-1